MPRPTQGEWWRSVISLLEDLDSDVADEPARVASAPGSPELVGVDAAQLRLPMHAWPPARILARPSDGRPDDDEPAAALERARRLSRAPRDEFYSPAAYERDLVELDERQGGTRRSAPTGLRRAQAIVAPTARARAGTRAGLGRGASSEAASSSLDLADGGGDRPAARAAVDPAPTERAISAPARARQAAAPPQPHRRHVTVAAERARSASPQRAHRAPAAAPAARPTSPVMSVEPLPPPPPRSSGSDRPPIASAAEQLETTRRQLRKAMTITHELSATNDRLRAQLAERDKKLSSYEARKKLGARQGIEQQQMLQALHAKLDDKDAQLRELQAKLREMERAAKPRSELEREQAHKHVLNLQRQLARLKAQLSEEFPTREHPFESVLHDADRLRTEHERRWRSERVKALDLTRALEQARARIAQVERERDALLATARGREPRAGEGAPASKPHPAQHDSRAQAPSLPRPEEVGYWIGGIALPAQPAGPAGRSTIQT